MDRDLEVSLPKRWPEHVKSAVIQAISLASMAFTAALGIESIRCDKLSRLRGRLHEAESEITLLKEEISIKDARLACIPAHRRPYYFPVQRMRILAIKAARGWSLRQVGKAFLISEQTVSSWMKRIDEDRENPLVQLREPVNRFPDFVHSLVSQLKLFFPVMGKQRIAHILARAGLHLGVTTVERMLKGGEAPHEGEPTGILQPEPVRIVTARYPKHVFHVDLTVVPTRAGFWVPWFPLALLQVWPFCWRVVAVIDHFSRLVIGFAIFPKHPSANDIQRFLAQAIRKTGRPPRHLISDQDSVFTDRAFRLWCKRKMIRQRFGAVGKHGSIGIIERFFRSMKSECTRRILVPMRLKEMRKEIGLYVIWFNEYRPHYSLGGRTPLEVYESLLPKNARPRLEPRPKWPPASRCATPQTLINGKRGGRLTLYVRFLEGRKHLPVIELRLAA